MSSLKRLLGFTLAVVVMAMMQATPATFAQSGTSSALTGTVVDSSGAAVVGAKITATDVNSKAVRTGETDASGRYLLAQVNPGNYLVAVERQSVFCLSRNQEDRDRKMMRIEIRKFFRYWPRRESLPNWLGTESQCHRQRHNRRDERHNSQRSEIRFHENDENGDGNNDC